MAEEFLTLMADLDDDSQQTLSGWYEEIKKEQVHITVIPRSCSISEKNLPRSYPQK